MIPVTTIDENGVTVPDFTDVLSGVQDDFKSIYGADIIITPDSQDGQFTSIIAAALNDLNQLLADVYNAFPPGSAQGVGLSRMVKINGIARRVATHSTAVVTITGVAGTVITNGVVTDTSGQSWDLPPTVTIGGGGTVDVTATAQEEGSIAAGAHAINGIGTPTLGWQEVDNAVAATLGAPVETDAQLRRRQAQSVAIPAQAILDSLSAAIGAVEGVTRYFVYENDTDAPDANGIPAHSISAVIAGGDTNDIGDAIVSRKPPGIQTYGTTDVTVLDSRGVPNTIHYYALAPVQVDVEITVDMLPGWVATTEDKIKAAVALFLNRLEIGEDSYLNRLFAPSNLSGQAALEATGLTQSDLDALAETFNITLIRQRRDADPLAASDVVIDFNEAALGDVTNITVILV